MHNLLLVITPEFPSHRLLDDIMYPYGYPTFKQNMEERWPGRFYVETVTYSDVEARIANTVNIDVECIEGESNWRSEGQVRVAARTEFQNRAQELELPYITTLTDITDDVSRRYRITVTAAYDLSKGIVAALDTVGDIDTDEVYMSWLGEGDHDILGRMLEKGTEEAAIAVDGKLQFYRLHGFDNLWDWWVIGGRWSNYLHCDINGRTNATRCNELSLDLMKSGERAYALDTMAAMLKLTVEEFEWRCRFSDYDRIISMFVWAVNDYVHLKKIILEYNGDLDPLDYASDCAKVKIKENLIAGRDKVLRNWVEMITLEQNIAPGELNFSHFNQTKVKVGSTSLHDLFFTLGKKIQFNDNFFTSTDVKLDQSTAVALTSRFNNYLDHMSRPVFVGTSVLLDDVWYDPWEVGVLNTSDNLVRSFHIPIENINEKHLPLFNFEDEGGIYYASIVELPEGRSIPWHMFVEGILGHPMMKHQFVTALDYHS